ncbi:MAG: DNA polymerase III subunit delta [Polyangiaceae bacterium]|nr:DNA polymerase III subunit delta [Polyangiaceae bacterium]
MLDELEARGEEALRPIFLVTGEEGFLVDEVVRKLQKVCSIGGLAGFNEDRFMAGEAHVDTVLASARSVPMMAKRRFVLVRSVERWESRSDDGEGATSKASKAASALDRLAAYAADPAPTAVLVLVASKLHAQRKIVTAAKKGGFIVQCDPLKRGEPAPWLMARAKRVGNPLPRDVAEHIADLVGSDLGALADALERLSLFVGPGATITEDAVSAMIAPVRNAAMWTLTDAICARDLVKTLRVMGELEIGRGAELPTLGAIASSVRKMVHFADHIAAGNNAQAAAEAAGLPPFKARDMERAFKNLPKGTLGRWMELCAQTDVDLKGGARRGSKAVLEGMILSMCAASPSGRAH